MDEFDLIRQHFSGLTVATEGVALGIGDDAALLDPRSGQQLAVTTDTLVAGRHFPLDTRPFDIGWKSLAVNLSDLAAMAAEPRWFTLALTLPEADAAWLQDFAAGLKQLADVVGIALVGGDTTRGALSISITAIGVVPSGQALRRDGAKAGDLIAVTGTLGDAALALAQRDASTFLRSRLDRPTPRIQAGLALRGLAHAVIDLSDGLAGDLAHILRASEVGAEVQVAALPRSQDFSRLAAEESVFALQLSGGDDYELCICLPPAQLEPARMRVEVPLTVIGRITADKRLRFLDKQGRVLNDSFDGFRHF